MYEHARRWMGAALVAGTVITLAPDLRGVPLQEGGDRRERVQEGDRTRDRARGDEDVKGRDAKGQRPPSDRGAGADQKRGDQRSDRASGEREQGRQRPSDRAVDATVGSMMRFENEHRRRTARIERLMRIYREKEDHQHLAELERLRERQRSIYREGLARYERELGPERFGQVRRGMERRGTDRPPGRGNERVADRPTDREHTESDRQGGATDRRSGERDGEHPEGGGKGEHREGGGKGEHREGDGKGEHREGDRGDSRAGRGDKPVDGKGGDGRKDA